MTDVVHNPGQGTGAPEAGEKKAPVVGEAPTWLKQDVNETDQTIKDPADNAGSSVLDRGTDTSVTDPPTVGEADGKDDAATGADDDIDHRGDYVPSHERQPRRLGTVARIGAGAVATIAALSSIFMIGRATGGDSDQKTNPEKTEEVGLPGQPDTTQPDNESKPIAAELSADPFLSPFGQPIEYDSSPSSLGSIKVYETQEDWDETDRNGDLADWFTGSAEEQANAPLDGNTLGDTLVGFTANSIQYKVESTGEIVKAWQFHSLPHVASEPGKDGKVKHGFVSFYDDGAPGGIATEGSSDNLTEFDRVAYAKKDVQIFPLLEGQSIVKARIRTHEDVSKLPSQRGAGGLVSTLGDNPEVEFVSRRPVLVIGDLTPEQVEATGRQLVRNAGVDEHVLEELRKASA